MFPTSSKGLINFSLYSESLHLFPVGSYHNYWVYVSWRSWCTCLFGPPFQDRQGEEPVQVWVRRLAGTDWAHYQGQGKWVCMAWSWAALMCMFLGEYKLATSWEAHRHLLFYQARETRWRWRIFHEVGSFFWFQMEKRGGGRASSLLPSHVLLFRMCLNFLCVTGSKKKNCNSIMNVRIYSIAWTPLNEDGYGEFAWNILLTIKIATNIGITNTYMP